MGCCNRATTKFEIVNCNTQYSCSDHLSTRRSKLYQKFETIIVFDRKKGKIWKYKEFKNAEKSPNPPLPALVDIINVNCKLNEQLVEAPKPVCVDLINANIELNKQLAKERKVNGLLDAKIIFLRSEVNYWKTTCEEEELSHVKTSIEKAVSSIKSKTINEQKTAIKKLKAQCHPDKHPLEMNWFYNKIFKLI